MAKTLAQGRKPGSGRKPGKGKTLREGRKPGSGRRPKNATAATATTLTSNINKSNNSAGIGINSTINTGTRTKSSTNSRGKNSKSKANAKVHLDDVNANTIPVSMMNNIVNGVNLLGTMQITQDSFNENIMQRKQSNNNRRNNNNNNNNSNNNNNNNSISTRDLEALDALRELTTSPTFATLNDITLSNNVNGMPLPLPRLDVITPQRPLLHHSRLLSNDKLDQRNTDFLTGNPNLINTAHLINDHTTMAPHNIGLPHINNAINDTSNIMNNQSPYGTNRNSNNSTSHKRH
ncbi:hypothetical protein Kpol_541p14 [Vanderwaltozyma polyspora DSM 70294]|uniref:Uncharacterized protein n=1 Tax=Vanderwaltozyma polyspora (strain ATCC 22028 / DSM 70294 / BCRC 21397 / CBS 2163 / NBRC 10782 / NRRL Y-8283 / UCD 57-17) TaxID=436907 RepID=A7TIV9_VANPO|nr:uncharacterized protein Kpol_541p14 [Vanderwaltozyma polyspora DSM 70294]EDO17771.1 hypothetical protein Kpol_541p14 [Vanderwaltozyma polyspora DSM 70294]